MNKRNFIICIGLLWISLIFSQDEENYQEKLIASFQLDSINYNFIEHLSAIDSLVTQDEIKAFESELNKIITSLPEKESKPKKEKKRIRVIYDIIHDALFNKYREVAFFTDIFHEGIYNCVTATAVYAYVFDKIDVPYAIKENPGHVFLIAYPESLRIHLETTAPGEFGFSSPKDNEIKDIVDNLVKMKLITSDEVGINGINKVYMDYFYGEEFVDKKALIGMQYYNLALEYYQAEDYKTALENINKSLIYFPYPSSKYLRTSLIFLNLSEMEFTSISDVSMLIDVFSKLDYDVDYNMHDLNYYLYKIVDNNDVDFMIKALNKFELFPNEVVRKEIEEFLYRKIASEYASNEMLDNAIVYAQKLLSLNSNDSRGKDIIIYAVGKKISLLPISDDSLQEIENYINQYPQLKDNTRVDSYRAHILVKLISDAFQEEDIKKGEVYISKLNMFIDQYGTNLLVNREYLAYGFFYAGKYYYQHNHFNQALEKLNRGLEFSPKNKDILKYIKWVKEEM